MLQFICEQKIETINKHDPDKIYTKYVKLESTLTNKQTINMPEAGIFNQEVELEIPNYVECVEKRDAQHYIKLQYRLYQSGAYDLSEIKLSNISEQDTLAAIWLVWTDGEFGMVPYTTPAPGTIRFSNDSINIKLPESEYLDYHIGINLYYTNKQSTSIPTIEFKKIEPTEAVSEGNVNLNFIYDQKNTVTIGADELTIGYTRQFKFLELQ